MSSQQKIQLVEFRVDHVDVIQELASKVENTRFTNVPHPYPTNGASSYRKICMQNAKSGSSLEYVVELNGAAIGMAGILHIQNIQETQVGYWIDQVFWNQGLGREIVNELSMICEAVIQTEIVYADVFPENAASIRVLELNGFQKLMEITLPTAHHKFPNQRMNRYQKCFTN